MTYKQHPLSAEFPKMSDADLCELAMDIKVHGQQVPGLLLDGQILDGWHRYQACEIAGKKFKAVSAPGADDPVKLVWSLNGARRHITKSQAASIVVSLEKYRLKTAKQKSAPGADSPAEPPKTTAELAELAGTSERTIEHAKAAESAGKGRAVRAGRVSAKKAAGDTPKAKPAPGADSKLAKRIMELEADVESKDARIAELEEALSDYGVLTEEYSRQKHILEVHPDMQLQEAMATIKKLSALNRTLEERLAGLQGERNMAVRAARRNT